MRGTLASRTYVRSLFVLFSRARVAQRRIHIGDVRSRSAKYYQVSVCCSRDNQAFGLYTLERFFAGFLGFDIAQGERDAEHAAFAGAKAELLKRMEEVRLLLSVFTAETKW